MVVLKTDLDFILDDNGEVFNTMAEGDNTRAFVNFLLSHLNDDLKAYSIIESLSDVEFLKGGCVSLEIDFNKLMTTGGEEAVEQFSTLINELKYK